MSLVDSLAAAWTDAEANSDEIDRLHHELLAQLAMSLDEAVLRLVVRLRMEVDEVPALNIDLAHLVLHMSPAGRAVAARYFPESISPGGLLAYR